MTSWPSINHSTLSPSGKASARTQKVARARARQELFGDGLARPQGPPQPSRPDRLRAQAAELRSLAARGMSPRKYTAKAAELEEEAASIEAAVARPTGDPERDNYMTDSRRRN